LFCLLVRPASAPGFDHQPEAVRTVRRRVVVFLAACRIGTLSGGVLDMQLAAGVATKPPIP
jgi:hypothetical protein